MAFFGIFLLAWVALLVFIIIICALVFVFVPCLVLSVISLAHGIKCNWPLWTRIVLGITGTIVTIFLIFIIWYLVWRFAFYIPPEYGDGSTSEMATALHYLL